MRKIGCLLAFFLLLSSCGFRSDRQNGIYTKTYLNLFDTVTTVMGRGESEETFRETAEDVYDDLLFYHKLFDIYQDYPGINNLKTVNDRAGIAPVAVDSAILKLLADCREYDALTGGRVNAAMGSVLSLWHTARSEGLEDPENAGIPDRRTLQKAAEHTDWSAVVLDEAASTVYITDPETQLDVGAMAKGWAVERVAKNTPEGMLISVGGNVRVTGPKGKETPWVIGIQDPDNAGSNRHTIGIKAGAVVTSGDYQRTYLADGVEYHHIIDPDTMMPATFWSSVTVVCNDSGLADVLSTALFLMPLEEGKTLAAECSAQVLWITPDGQEYMTNGFREMLRE